MLPLLPLLLLLLLLLLNQLPRPLLLLLFGPLPHLVLLLPRPLHRLAVWLRAGLSIRTSGGEVDAGRLLPGACQRRLQAVLVLLPLLRLPLLLLLRRPLPPPRLLQRLTLLNLLMLVMQRVLVLPLGLVRQLWPLVLVLLLRRPPPEVWLRMRLSIRISGGEVDGEFLQPGVCR